MMTPWLKWLILSVLLLMPLSCARIDKHILVLSEGGDVSIIYTTSSDTDVNAADLLDATIPLIP